MPNWTEISSIPSRPLSSSATVISMAPKVCSPALVRSGCIKSEAVNLVYNTEPELGVAIKESAVPRDQLYVVTKVIDGVADIPKAFAASLKKLQLDYVDLYLIHAPFFAKSPGDLEAAWRSMEEIRNSGKAKAIGVSNFQADHLATIAKTATILPAINQIEYHPYLQQRDLIAFHKKHGIATSAYAPLTPVTKARPGPAYDVIAKIAGKYSVSEGEVALRWCIDQGVVAITTSSKESRMKEYLGATTFELTEEEVQEISKAGEGKNFRGFWKTKLLDEK